MIVFHGCGCTSNGYSASLGNDCDENKGINITLIPVIANQQRMLPVINDLSIITKICLFKINHPNLFQQLKLIPIRIRTIKWLAFVDVSLENFFFVFLCSLIITLHFQNDKLQRSKITSTVFAILAVRKILIKYSALFCILT